jgi:hypothetical protein
VPTNASLHALFRLPQYFTVREPEMAVQTMTVKDVGGSGWSSSTSPTASEQEISQLQRLLSRPFSTRFG